MSGRYAPSPTGRLHLGNLRTALLAWLQARLSGIDLIMRIDDLDQSRVRLGVEQPMLDDLKRLGIAWDQGPDIGGEYRYYRQSQRIQRYDATFFRLAEMGRVYGCQCSRRDIAAAISAPHHNQHYIYPGTCQSRDIRPRVNNLADYSWRYRVSDRSITAVDTLLPPLTQNMARDVGDLVIRRRDGAYGYHFANVIDDAEMAISHVVRGADLFSSTPCQIELQNALGYPHPSYWHVPLALDNEGQRMAKRNDSTALDPSDGSVEPLIGNWAEQLGLARDNQPLSASTLLQSLDLGRLKRALQKASDSNTPRNARVR